MSHDVAHLVFRAGVYRAIWHLPWPVLAALMIAAFLVISREMRW